MAVVILDTGHAAAFRARFGLHKTGPLISGMVSVPMNAGGGIGGLAHEFQNPGVNPNSIRFLE
jgi:hypothetical protein